MAVWGSLAACFLSLAIFLYLSSVQVPGDNGTFNSFNAHVSNAERNGTGQVVASSRYLRLAIFLIVNILISVCAVFSIVSAITVHINRVIDAFIKLDAN